MSGFVMNKTFFSVVLTVFIVGLRNVPSVADDAVLPNILLYLLHKVKSSHIFLALIINIK